MALFGFQLRIANQHNAHVAHVVMHIHLFERRCTKPTGIIGSECEPREFIDPGQTFRESLLGGSRKIVIAHTRHHIETVVDVPVELNIAVDVVLRMGCIVTKLIGGEIVMQDISSHQEVVSAQRVTVEGMRHMLPVTVVVVVRTGTVGQIVRLIVLVVRIRQLQFASVVPCIGTFQSTAVAIEAIGIGVAFAGAMEIAATAHQCEPI